MTARQRTGSGRRSRGVGALSWLSVLLALLLGLLGCSSKSNTQGLLAGLAPISATNVDHPERITDGEVPPEGAPWMSSWTSVSEGPGRITYDLGAPQRIAAAWIHSDHNDGYALLGSLDGKRFSTIWTAPAVPAPGLRARMTRDLDVTARYLRIEPRGGDGAFSVSELLVFDTVPETWPIEVERIRSADPGATARTRLAVVTLLGLLWLLLLPSRATRERILLYAALPLAASIWALGPLAAVWPWDSVTVSLVRAAVALLGGAAVIRLTSPTSPSFGATCRRALVVASVVGACSFFHFGRPQFFDQSRGEPSFVHYFDMRVYFPQAKYFPELGFDGVYAASVAAMTDDDPTVTAETLAATPLRDLRTHAVVRVADVRDHIAEVRERFTAERWEEFVADMRYFRETLGSVDYLRSLLDHGGNATPTWLALSRLLFAPLSASHTTLVWTSLIDPLLLLGALVAVARSFGPMPALVCALVFGANDFHMGGGTNWAGATLRHDWLAALIGGVAALRARRYRLGGALIGAASMLRAFPVLMFVGVALHLGWLLLDRRRGHETAPLHPSVEVLAAGAASALGLGLLSVVVLSPSAWVDWLEKMRLLSGEAHPNHISLRLLFAFDPNASFEALDRRGMGGAWQRIQALTFQRHALGFYTAATSLSLFVAAVCRRAPPHRAALLGLAFVFIWLYPANYYLHFFCALPLLASAPHDFREQLPKPAALVWVSLLSLCALSYLTVETAYTDMHYIQLTVLTFATLPPLWIALRRQDRLAQGPAPA